MKTLLLFLALTAPMLAQDQTIQTRNEYQTLFPAPDTSNVFQDETIRPDTLNRVTNSMNRDTIWQYIAVRTPSGKVVRMDRVIEHVIDYDALKYDVAIPFNTVRDSVLTTGCPVCGSDKRKTWRVEVRDWEPDTLAFYKPTTIRLEKRTWFTVDGVRYSVCDDCGTVYHGRRK